MEAQLTEQQKEERYNNLGKWLKEVNKQNILKKGDAKTFYVDFKTKTVLKLEKHEYCPFF
jgi:hypothetical protein